MNSPVYRKIHCPACQHPMTELVDFVWYCENSSDPHLWHGASNVMLSGVFNETALRLAAHIWQSKHWKSDYDDNKTT